MIADRFIWKKSIRQDIRQWAKHCLACQGSKIHKHTRSLLSAFPLLDDRFRHIHVAIVGSLPPSNSSTHITTWPDDPGTQRKPQSRSPSYAAWLKDHSKSLRPIPTHLNCRASKTPNDLSTCYFVFVRVVSVQPPYVSPFKILKHKPKYYVIYHNGNKDSVSIGRLNPAYFDPTDSPSLANSNS